MNDTLLTGLVSLMHEASLICYKSLATFAGLNVASRERSPRNADDSSWGRCLAEPVRQSAFPHQHIDKAELSLLYRYDR